MKPVLNIKKLVVLCAVMMVAASFGIKATAHAATPSLSLSANTGKPGSAVQVSGSSFVSGETVNIFMGSLANPSAGVDTVRGDGLWGPITVTIPLNAVPGSLVIAGKSASSSDMASATFIVTPLSPTINIASSTFTPGSVIHITGNGFGPNESVLISLDTATSTLSADGGGNFATDLTIPSLTPNTYVIHATGQSSAAAASAYIYVSGFYPTVLASTFYAHPGDMVSWSGSGFAPNETVDIINASGTALASIAADGTGSFTNTGSFAIPYGATDKVTFTASSSISKVQIPVTISLATFISQITPSVFFLQRTNSFMVTGTGFAPNESVTVKVRGNALQTLQTDSRGNFTSGPLIVPLSSPPTLGVLATGLLSGAIAQTSVSVGDVVPRTIEPATLVLNLLINNTFGGAAIPRDFSMAINGARANPNILNFNGASSTASTSLISATTTATTTMDGDTDFTISFIPLDPSYKPQWQGNCNGQIVAGDIGICTVTAVFSPAISISPLSLQAGTVGTSFNQTLTIETTAKGPFTWNISSGALPDGLTINTSSTDNTTTITGQFTKLGTFSFIISASNGAVSTSQSYSITVNLPSASGGGGGGGGFSGGGGGGAITVLSASAPNASSIPTASKNKMEELGALMQHLVSLQKQLFTQEITTATCPANLSQNVSLGNSGLNVKRLQQILNSSQLTRIATSGLNSPGNETGKFDSLTLKSVIALQNIFADDVLKPAGLTTATGFVGKATRDKLNSLCNLSATYKKGPLALNITRIR